MARQRCWIALRHICAMAEISTRRWLGAPLREAIAAKVEDLYGLTCDPETEVTITAGATQALFCAIAALVHPGDEVIVLDPAYDSYDPVIRLQGGVAVHLPLKAPGFRMDWQRIRDAITPRTRLLILNSPHNPTGMVMQEDDMQALSALCTEHDIYLIGDEVYEHMVFDQQTHLSLCAYPDLYARSFVISSFGKTYHVTGWKVGYCVAPPELTLEFRRIHQYVTFTVNTLCSWGLRIFCASIPNTTSSLRRFTKPNVTCFAGCWSHRDSLQCPVRAPIFSFWATRESLLNRMMPWPGVGLASRESPPYPSACFIKIPKSVSIWPCVFALPRTMQLLLKLRKFYVVFSRAPAAKSHPLAGPGREP